MMGPLCPLSELDNPQLVTYLTNCKFKFAVANKQHNDIPVKVCLIDL